MSTAANRRASDELIRHALELVTSEVEESAAARRIAAEAGPAELEAAVEQLMLGLYRNPIVDVTGIRAARMLLSASQVAA